MTTTMQLSDLMTAVRQRADMCPQSYAPSLSGNTSLFVADAELIQLINQSYFELYDLMVSKYGDNYFVKAPYTFVTDGTTLQYTLPTDLYKLLGVDLLVNAGDPQSGITLRPFEMGERNQLGAPFMARARTSNMRYRINAGALWLNPLATSGQTIQLWYVPRLTTLVALSDTADGISGWTEYVIVDAAIKCLTKEESDASVLMAQKQALMMRIEAMAENRDAGSPPKVTDVWGDSGGSDWNGNGWGGW